MEAGRQLLRWGIPGGVAAIFLGLFYVLAIFVGLVVYQLPISGTAGLYLATLGRIRLASVAVENILAWAGGSLVLGFLLHQAYYWLYWYAPLPRGWILGQDRARAMLKWVEDDWREELGVVIDRSTAKAALRQAKLGPWKLWWEVKDRQEMMKFKRNWQTVNAIWYRALAQEPARGVGVAVNAEAG